MIVIVRSVMIYIMHTIPGAITSLVHRQKRPFYTVISAPKQKVLLIFELISPPVIELN